MNYIKEATKFHGLVSLFKITPAEQALWHALFELCNRLAWQKRFTASIQSLQINANLSKNGVVTARKKLIDHGLIKYYPRGTWAAEYELISLEEMFPYL